MHTTKLWVMGATLALLALGLGPMAPRAQAQLRPDSALRYSATPSLESQRYEAVVTQRRSQLGLGIAGIVTGAVGLVVGGPLLLIAGTTRRSCTGGLWSGYHCVSAADDAGDILGGVLSLGLGAVGVITGIVLIASRPDPHTPRLSFDVDASSASVRVSGSF